jgi:thiol-disulfide isomerase/thioredoxin
MLKRAAHNTLGLKEFRPGRPAVLYFTMEGCIPCRTTQRPALGLLREMTASQVQIIEVDVVAQADLANEWGVLSVPTTFIIDQEGQPRQVNHGVALTEKLLDQLEKASGRKLKVEEIPPVVEIAAPDTGTD